MKLIQRYKAYKKDKKLRLRMGDMYLKTYGATWEQIYNYINSKSKYKIKSYKEEILNKYK